MLATRKKTRPSRIVQIPSLPELKSLDRTDRDALQRYLLALKELGEIRDGANRRGVDLDKAVTWEDLVNMGFDIGAKNQSTTPYNFSNNRLPVERWDDLRFSIGAASSTANQPDKVDVRGCEVWAFGSLLPNEHLHWQLQMPHSWKYGSKMELHMHTGIETNGSGGGAENVKFDFTYSWANIGGDFPVETTETVTIDVQNRIANRHYYDDFVIIDGTGKGLSSILLCSLTRDTGVSGDYGSDCYMFDIDFHVQIDKFGSLQETTNERG